MYIYDCTCVLCIKTYDRECTHKQLYIHDYLKNMCQCVPACVSACFAYDESGVSSERSIYKTSLSVRLSE